jgi:hypothetical protein
LGAGERRTEEDEKFVFFGSADERKRKVKERERPLIW